MEPRLKSRHGHFLMTPLNLAQWWFHVTDRYGRHQLIVALDVAAFGLIVMLVDNWAAAGVAAVRDLSSALAHAIPSRIQLGWAFTTGMLALVFYRMRSNNKIRADQGMFVLGCGAVGGFAADLLKVIFGRARPDSFAEVTFNFNFLHGGDGFDSLPSSHAAIAAALATGLSIIWPAHRRKYLVVAAVVAASRCLDGAHYPSDAVLGFALGMGVAVGLQVVFCQCGMRVSKAQRR